jgi:drug/metabolite transporter (DMT)-like permease
MTTLLAIIFAFGSAISYGIAIVLEQVGAKKVEPSKSLNPLQFIQFFKRWEYNTGLILDVVGLVLTLLAVRWLPLFLAQSIFASSLIFTVLINRYFYKKRIKPKEVKAIIIIIIGLCLLSFVAVPSKAHFPSLSFRLFLILAPILIAIVGLYLIRVKNNRHKPVIIAFIAGLSFSLTIIIERIIPISHPLYMILLQPLTLSLIILGVLGMLLFTKALQEGNINKINGAIYSIQIFTSAVFGLIFLGDSIKNGLWPVLFLGCVAVLAGTIWLSLSIED